MKTEKLLEFYTLGFKNQLSEEKLPIDLMLKKAYELGKKHFLAGNDLYSINYLNDEIVSFLIEKDAINSI